MASLSIKNDLTQYKRHYVELQIPLPLFISCEIRFKQYCEKSHRENSPRGSSAAHMHGKPHF